MRSSNRWWQMRFGRLRRRDFITFLGGAAAWPLAARAQQAGLPMIGFMSSLKSSDQASVMTPFHRGLGDAGFIEGRNLAIEYRWAEGRYEQLPELAVDLTRRQVAVIAAISGTPAALAAKAATTTIPIVFAMASDPVDAGLIVSLNRPGGNITGATFFTALLGAKRVGLLRELVAKATTIALLVNPDNRVGVLDGTSAQAAAHAIGLRTRIFEVRAGREIDAVFATLAHERPDALYVNPDALFFTERNRIVALAARYAVPAIYADRETAEAGGLLSYGASRTEAYRQAGTYVGRILRGEKPGDLPVVLPTKYQLVINLKTAKALGLAISDNLLSIADDVIE
jgi:putative tryptophan/tyrosine transport system substrate-binding protein